MSVSAEILSSVGAMRVSGQRASSAASIASMRAFSSGVMLMQMAAQQELR